MNKGISKLFTFLVFALIGAPQLGAQNICITPPEDIVWDCGEEDWNYVYTQTDDVVVHQCDDITNELFQQIELIVDVDTLGCSDPSSPNVVSRITRTFLTPAPLQNSECGTWVVCATQTIDIVDFEAPTFTAFPTDTLISCEDWDLLDYLISGLFQVDFNDNCGIVDQTIDLDTLIGYCAAEREFQWEFTLVDACNNTRIDTHFVNVVDTIGPEFSFTPPQELAIPFKCKDLVVWPLLDAYDMCSAVENVEWGEVTETQLSCPNHWEMSRWAYAVDACGNEDSTQYFIEVLDDEAPEINYVPLGFSKSCEDIPVLENAIAIDNCLGEVDITVETDTVFGDCPQTYTMTRTFTATDNCGNSSTAQQLIIVEDFQSPQLTVPDDYTVECSYEIIFDPPIAFDNCDDTPLVEEEQEIVNVQSTGTYTIERIFTITDDCGNSTTGMQTIDVVDTTPPYFTEFPADIEVPCDEDYPTDPVEFADACDPNPELLSINISENYEDCANESVVYRTFEIEDDAGNSYYQTQTITFVDDAPPYFTFVPENTQVECSDDIDYQVPEFDDECSPEGMTIDIDNVIENELCDDNYDLIRYFTVTDACGLTTTASQFIEVRDLTAPVLETELDSLFFYCSYNMPSCDETFSELEFSDECGSNDSSFDCEDVVVEGECEDQACVIERTYFWQDGCGNSAQASHFIRVEETVFAPTLPTGITPNGDNLNDNYVILDIGPLIAPGEGAPCDWIPNTRFKVVNRWGQIVFDQENYRNDWNGVDDNGEPLAPGTYFIIFEASGHAYSTFVDIRR